MYGNISTYPQDESAMFDPISAYGISKLTSYHLVKSYRINFNFFGCSAILFNHESPRRDMYFVTRKISNGVALIKKGLKKNINLGNVNSSRDWGHAKDYVNAMWLMLQKEKPEDYVIGTGKKHTVLEFAKIAFNHVGLNHLDFINIDKNLVRDVESDNRIANSAKAIKNLDWKPKYNFEDLVCDMVDSDLKLIENNK